MPAPGDVFNPYRMFTGCFIPNAVCLCRDLSARAKLVFGRLCQYAGEKGQAYPTYRALAWEVGVERRQAMRAIQELEDFGLIRAVKQYRKDGGSRSNVYVFLWHEIFESDPAPAPASTVGELVTREGAISGTLPGSRRSDKRVPDKAPKENHTKESEDEETTTGGIRRLLAGTPLETIADRELHALAHRHGAELLQLAADIAAETWRREGEEIRNPGGYLQSLCSALVIPAWYESVVDRQIKAQEREKRKQAEQQSLQLRQAEAEQEEASREEYWQSLSQAERNTFISLVKSAYPSLQLPAVALTATAKALAWEEQATP